MKINGNKLNIGLIITFLPSLVSNIFGIWSKGGDTASKIIETAGQAVVVAGAIHKIAKGEKQPEPTPKESEQ